MLMAFKMHDYLAVGITAGAVIVFIFLLCWHGYTEWKEEERLRQRRAKRRCKHG